MKKITFLLATLLTAGIGTAGAQETVDVTYTYTLNGETIGQRTVTETVGSAPTDNVVPTDYVSAEGYPETVTETAYTISTSYKNTLPFAVSTESEEHWYIIDFYINNKYDYWKVPSGSATLRENLDNLNDYTIANQDIYKFKLGGDWLNGFTIQHKSGKYVTSPDFTNANAQNRVLMTDTEGENNKSRFTLEKRGNELAFRLKSDTQIYLAHYSNQDLTVCVFYRSDYQDAGFGLHFTEVGDFAEEVASARALLNKTDVGYPSATAATRTALQNALGTDDARVTKTNLTTEVVQNYKLETDIKLPEDGHVYVFTNKHPDAGLHYMYHDTAADKLKFADRGETPVNELPDAAKYVCHVTEDGKYLFANIETGNYLIWRGANAGTNNNKGYMPDYDAAYCPFKMEKCVKTDANMGAAESTADLVGCVNFGAKRASITCFVYHKGGASADYFIQDGGWTPRYTTDYSTAFFVEEVTDYTANSATLRQASGKDEYYSTLWLPYSTNIPEGIQAYTAAAEGDQLRLTPLEGAIPARTGVVLFSETAQTDVLFAPAAQSTANVEKGQLTGSRTAVTATGNEYALSGAGGRAIGFYPVNAGVSIPAGRAYYAAGQSNVQGFTLVIGSGDATGIGTAPTTATGKPAAIYDLQGRSVTRPSAHGIYIVNGKKMILK